MGDSTRLKSEPALQAGSFGNTKIVVLGLDTLRLYILRNDLVGYVPAAGHEVPSRPQVSTPELLLQSPKIRQQMVRRLALDGLHHPARRYTRRHTQQQVHMFSTHMSTDNLDIVAAADLPNQRHVTPQHRLAVLRGEHEMIVQ